MMSCEIYVHLRDCDCVCVFLTPDTLSIYDCVSCVSLEDA